MLKGSVQDALYNNEDTSVNLPQSEDLLSDIIEEFCKIKENNLKLERKITRLEGNYCFI